MKTTLKSTLKALLTLTFILTLLLNGTAFAQSAFDQTAASDHHIGRRMARDRGDRAGVVVGDFDGQVDFQFCGDARSSLGQVGHWTEQQDRNHGLSRRGQ